MVTFTPTGTSTSGSCVHPGTQPRAARGAGRLARQGRRASSSSTPGRRVECALTERRTCATSTRRGRTRDPVRARLVPGLDRLGRRMSRPAARSSKRATAFARLGVELPVQTVGRRPPFGAGRPLRVTRCRPARRYAVLWISRARVHGGKWRRDRFGTTSKADRERVRATPWRERELPDTRARCGMGESMNGNPRFWHFAVAWHSIWLPGLPSDGRSDRMKRHDDSTQARKATRIAATTGSTAGVWRAAGHEFRVASEQRRIALLRGAFEEALRESLAVRTVQLRDRPARWAAEASPTASSRSPSKCRGRRRRPRRARGRRSIRDARPGEWDFQMLGMAAHLGALRPRNRTRTRTQLARAELAPAEPRSRRRRAADRIDARHAQRCARESSAWRAPTSRCCSRARAASARSWWRGRFTS